VNDLVVNGDKYWREFRGFKPMLLETKYVCVKHLLIMLRPFQTVESLNSFRLYSTAFKHWQWLTCKTRNRSMHLIKPIGSLCFIEKKNIYRNCSVLVGSRSGFDRD